MKFIITDNYLLMVDETAEIKLGEWGIHNKEQYRKDFPNTNHIVQCNESNQHTIQEHWDKILSHLPLNSAPLLEGVEVLPPLEAQEMPADYYPPKDLAATIWGNCFDYKNIDEKYEGESIRERVKGACFGAERYAVSQDRKYSEADVRNAIEMALSLWINREQGATYKSVIDIAINAINAPKLPVGFVLSDKYPTLAENIKHGHYIYE